MANPFWKIDEFVPSSYAIPKEKQLQAYNVWSKDHSKENMQKIIETFDTLTNSEIGRYAGTLDKNILKNFAKKYIADAVRTFKPGMKNQLSTHIVNQLQRLHRLNYRNVQGLRSSEEAQAKLSDYSSAREELENRFNREPTEEEISKEIDYKVKKLNPFMKYEYIPSNLMNQAIFYEPNKEMEAVENVHYDLPEMGQKVLEFKTGYNGKPILSGREIAKELKVSPVRISQISNAIGKKIQEYLGR